MITIDLRCSHGCHLTASMVISSLWGAFPINENKSVLIVSKKDLADLSKPLLMIFTHEPDWKKLLIGNPKI